jgi:hypothetical protein
MWMNQYLEPDVDETIARGFPSYCNNPTHNFRYDAYWDYSNITCRVLPLSQLFVKSLTQGTYFVTSMVQRQRGISCPDHKQPPTTSEVCFPTKNSSETEFMLGIEDLKLAGTISVSVPELGCSPCTIETPTVIEYGNGTTVSLSPAEGATPDFSVGRWLELFGVAGGLDGTNELVRVKDSVGNPRHRHVGMGIEIRVSVKNTWNALEVPSRTPERLRVHWTVNTNRDWNRLVLQDEHDPLLPKNERLQSTDLYGLRIKWEMSESEVYVFSWFNFAMGVIDCVVVLNISKLLAIQVALWLCGRKSTEWRRALRSPIDQVIVGRQVARKTIIERNSFSSSSNASNKVAVRPTEQASSMASTSTLATPPLRTELSSTSSELKETEAGGETSLFVEPTSALPGD